MSVIVRVHVVAIDLLDLLVGNPEASLPGFAKRHRYDAMLLGALTHRPGVTEQVGTLTSRLVESLECDFLLVKPRTYQSHVGEIYPRPDSTSRIGV